MTERSASFRDPASGRVHIARVRYVKNWYAGEFPSTFAEVAKAYADHNVTDPRTKQSYFVPASAIARGFLAMGAGNWDIYFMQGRTLPGLNQTRNVTAAMEYWDASIRVLARMIDDARRSTALGRVPIFWRDQPLPRCDSHRFSRPAKASLRCVDVLRPVVIPFYRKRASEILTAAGLVVLPVDHLVHPTERHSSSTALPATKPPPPWFSVIAGDDSAGLLCPLGDGIHIESPCMLLQQHTYWSFAAQWYPLFDTSQPPPPILSSEAVTAQPRGRPSSSTHSTPLVSYPHAAKHNNLVVEHVPGTGGAAPPAYGSITTLLGVGGMTVVIIAAAALGRSSGFA
jgi:hypothetical protein